MILLKIIIKRKQLWSKRHPIGSWLTHHSHSILRTQTEFIHVLWFNPYWHTLVEKYSAVETPTTSLPSWPRRTNRKYCVTPWLSQCMVISITEFCCRPRRYVYFITVSINGNAREKKCSDDDRRSHWVSMSIRRARTTNQDPNPKPPSRSRPRVC